jgi:hypothetical protein
MRMFEYKSISIENLYINPENYRYINDAYDETSAIIYMFNLTTGTPTKEMINLSKDIVEDGLNPFEMPIVCYDEDLEKYVVYDGNRRITCIKLMTQYKNNDEILRSIPSVNEIYELEYSDVEIQCVIYNNSDDAKHFLDKIHKDVNDGIGRKQWDYQAKMKANAVNGNKSKTYAIVEFVKGHTDTEKSLIIAMDTHRWISKLERVVGFAKFKEAYNITFDSSNSLVYKDSEKHVLFMMSKLISDLIQNTATNNFRFKNDFDNYILNLDVEFKTQVSKNTPEVSTAPPVADIPKPADITPNTEGSENVSTDESVGNDTCASTPEELPAAGQPRSISKQHLAEKAALRLGKNYTINDYSCLNEKGKQMLVELESLNIKDYPFATAALCRALLECVIKLWIDAESGTTFSSKTLSSTYNVCLTSLRNKKIIDDKEHKVLTAQINKENYIDLLNTWIHSDTSACVSEANLTSGWKNTRLLVEKYIDTHKK